MCIMLSHKRAFSFFFIHLEILESRLGFQLLISIPVLLVQLKMKNATGKFDITKGNEFFFLATTQN